MYKPYMLQQSLDCELIKKRKRLPLKKLPNHLQKKKKAQQMMLQKMILMQVPQPQPSTVLMKTRSSTRFSASTQRNHSMPQDNHLGRKWFSKKMLKKLVKKSLRPWKESKGKNWTLIWNSILTKPGQIMILMEKAVFLQKNHIPSREH